MATMKNSDIDKYALDFEELASIPESVIDEMLKEEGRVIKRAQYESASSRLAGPYNKGAVKDAIALGEPKRTADGKSVYVSFRGKQHKTRIAEIAFINEFGKHNQPARPFIREANEAHASEAVDAAAKVYDDYLSKKGF